MHGGENQECSATTTDNRNSERRRRRWSREVLDDGRDLADARSDEDYGVDSTVGPEQPTSIDCRDASRHRYRRRQKVDSITVDHGSGIQGVYGIWPPPPAPFIPYRFAFVASPAASNSSKPLLNPLGVCVASPGSRSPPACCSPSSRRPPPACCSPSSRCPPPASYRRSRSLSSPTLPLSGEDSPTRSSCVCPVKARHMELITPDYACSM
ncbi:hypothetical protein PIB30_036832 [Stylosanthes scabra]|uniref:Uncharacterized protein n=1 Tax=Stylosanthes scabra TaxID=79078 RepID=A0ABU6RDL8_9FABA|nr:hypothetical protein [Stylosanthes scabra]